jgi:hypothetical protein
MITLPVWAFVLCLAGGVFAAAVIAAAVMLLYIGRGLWS